METKTMKQVIWQKCIECADEMTLREISSFIIKPILVILISAGMITNGKFFDAMMQWRKFTIPMIITAIVMVYGIPLIFRLLQETQTNIIERMRRSPVTRKQGYIENTPTHPLVDHIIATNSFKRAEIETMFKMPRKAVCELAERLEGMGVLTRGGNNSRVLSEGITKERLLHILDGKTVNDVREEINIVRNPPSFIRRELTMA